MLAWRKGFYGYSITAGAFLVFLLLGGGYYGLSVLVPVMAGELLWSATAFGAAFSIFALILGLGSPLAGAFVVRFGPRQAIFVGSLIVAAAFLLLSVIGELWEFYACVFMAGMGMSLGGLIPVQQIVGNWFVRRRSLFLGLVLTGAGVGGLIVSALAGVLVVALGSWRTSWQVLAGVMLVPALVAVFLLKNSPEELGQVVDGVTDATPGRADACGQQRSSRVYKSAYQWEARAAIRTRAFASVAVASGTMFFVLQSIMAHQVAYLGEETGQDLAVAAYALGLMAGISIIGRLLAGWLGDRIEPRVAMGGFLLLQALGLLILLISQSPAFLYLYVALTGLGYGGMVVLPGATLLNYFGPKNFAAIQGIAFPIGTVLGALSPLLTGSIKDVSGSYVPAFAMMMSIAAMGAVLAFSARPPLPQASAAPQPMADPTSGD